MSILYFSVYQKYVKSSKYILEQTSRFSLFWDSVGLRWFHQEGRHSTVSTSVQLSWRVQITAVSQPTSIVITPCKPVFAQQRHTELAITLGFSSLLVLVFCDVTLWPYGWFLTCLLQLFENNTRTKAPVFFGSFCRWHFFPKHSAPSFFSPRSSIPWYTVPGDFPAVTQARRKEWPNTLMSQDYGHFYLCEEVGK